MTVLDYYPSDDSVTGRIERLRSDGDGLAWYHFQCEFGPGHDGSATITSVTARSKLPDHRIKGISTGSRSDVRQEAASKARMWRNRKLVEQELLTKIMEDPSLSRLTGSRSLAYRGGGLTRTGVWTREALLVRPADFGFGFQSKWIEVIPVGAAPQDVVQLVLDIYSEGGDEPAASAAAVAGHTAAEIRRMHEMVRAGASLNKAAKEFAAKADGASIDAKIHRLSRLYREHKADIVLAFSALQHEASRVTAIQTEKKHQDIPPGSSAVVEVYPRLWPAPFLDARPARRL